MGNCRHRDGTPTRRYHTPNVSASARKTYASTAEQDVRRLAPEYWVRLQRFSIRGSQDLRDQGVLVPFQVVPPICSTDLTRHHSSCKLNMSSIQSSLGRRKRASQPECPKSVTHTTTTTEGTPYNGVFQQHLSNRKISPSE